MTTTAPAPRETGTDPSSPRPDAPATATSPSTAARTSTSAEPAAKPWTQRTVEAITDRLSRRKLGRRSFLTRTALVGSALAVDPINFILKPTSAWASVCGADNECNEGWSAFCATINDGANTCPSGSYPAGWWKIDNTTFCSGRARYIVDCNVSPGASYSCRCADGACDRRRVACNNFRYGQCNTQISGTTPVVCRIVLCTPPWEWGNCTTTSLTSNQTRTHWSSRLPSRTNPTPILVRWLEMGLTGSTLGDIVGSERDADDGGSWARFRRGVLTQRPGRTSTTLMTGLHATSYTNAGGPDSPLGYPRSSVTGNPVTARYDNGSTYRDGDTVTPLWGELDEEYRRRGAVGGWMGFPRGRVDSFGPWRRIQTDSGWWLVESSVEGRARVLRNAANLPSDGRFPPTAGVVRWSGSSRYDTAVEVSQYAYPDGADTAIVARGDGFADATAAGAVSHRLRAPILLTNKGSLAAATRDELRRLRPSRVYVMGGTGAVSAKAVRAIRDIVPDSPRVAGEDRYDTAVRLSRVAFPDGDADWVVLCSGQDFPDSLAVAPQAERLGAPVLLTATNRLPDVVANELRRIDPAHVLIVGGGSAVSGGVADRVRDVLPGVDVDRVAGDSRYQTSAKVAELLGGDSRTVMVTTGRDFPDGLAAASYANARRIPLLLVDGSINGAVDAEIRSRSPERIIVLGGTGAVSEQRVAQLNGYRT